MCFASNGYVPRESFDFAHNVLAEACPKQQHKDINSNVAVIANHETFDINLWLDWTLSLGELNGYRPKPY